MSEIIKFKWELETEYKYFQNFNDLVKELRNGGVDEDNESSDDFLINESYNLGEWELVQLQNQKK